MTHLTIRDQRFGLCNAVLDTGRALQGVDVVGTGAEQAGLVVRLLVELDGCRGGDIGRVGIAVGVGLQSLGEGGRRRLARAGAARKSRSQRSPCLSAPRVASLSEGGGGFGFGSVCEPFATGSVEVVFVVARGFGFEGEEGCRGERRGVGVIESGLGFQLVDMALNFFAPAGVFFKREGGFGESLTASELTDWRSQQRPRSKRATGSCWWTAGR